MKRKTFLIYHLVCAFHIAVVAPAFGQDLQKTDIDHMLKRAGAVANLEEKEGLYMELLASIANESKDHGLELLRYAARRDTTRYGQGKVTAVLAEELNARGAYADFMDFMDGLIWTYIDLGDEKALALAEQWLQLSQTYGNFLGSARAIEAKGLFHEIVKGDVETASRFYFEAIAIAEDKALPYLANLHHNVGAMFHESDNYEKALVYYEQAYEEAKRQNNLELQKKALINMASVNSSINEFDRAEELFFKSLEIKLPSDITYNYDFDTYANLGNLFLRQEKYKDAIAYLSKATEQVPENPNSEANLRFLIDAKLKADDTLGLGNLVERLDKTLTVTSSAREKALLTRTMADYYRKINAHGQAYEYYEKYIGLYEGLVENMKDETLLELEAKYQNEKLSALVEQRKKQRQLYLLALVASLALSAVLFLFFRNRLKYQKLLAQQNNDLQRQKITELTQKNKLVAMTGMLEGQEAERLRIAKDLHDSLGGLLSNIKAHFTIIKNEVPPLEKSDTAARTKDLIDTACLEVRRISHNMMPHALSISGLEGAVEDLAEHMRSLNYEVTLDVQQLPKGLDITKEITLFRMLQELLSNIRKHAAATTVFLQLFGHDKGIQLVVEDNGKGFDHSRALANGGLGLKSVESRVEFLDGTIAWDSVLQQGTTVTVNIPV